MRQRRRAGLMLVLLPLALGAERRRGVRGRHTRSELERELYRELHKMPPAAVFPSPETLACYERLGKIAHFAPLPIRVEPAQCARFDLVRLDRVVMPDQTFVAVTPPPQLQCSMAEAVAEWVRADVGPAAAELGAPLAADHRARFLRVPRPQQHPGRQAVRARQGQRARHRRDQARNGATFTLTDPLVSKPFREQMRTLGLRPLHHRAGAGLGRLPRGAHPSRSRRALARLSDLPVERARSGGDRRGGAAAAAAADQSHVRPDPVARARHK